MTANGKVDIQDLISNTNDLVAGSAAADSDQIQVWNGTKFTVYFYRAYKSKNPGKFTYGPCWVDGTSATTASEPAHKDISRGVGVWFARPSSAKAGVITLSGSIDNKTKNLPINTGFNMIGSAFPVDISVNSNNCPIVWSECAVAGSAAADSDQIQIWNGSKFTVYFYRAYKSKNPGKFTYGPCWVDGTSATTASEPAKLTIKSGEAFWYARPSTGSEGVLPQKSPLAPAAAE